MELLFSPSTCGFFLPEVHADEAPDDCVPVTAERYRELIEQQEAGLLLTSGEDGHPKAVERVFEVTGRHVDAERDRRINAGVTFNETPFQSGASDRENIAGAAQLAFMAVVGGVEEGDLRWARPEEDFAWIASDNSLVPMDAQTVVAFGKAAAERKQALIFAGRVIKDMEPIPADYTDDKWWP